MFHPWKQEFYMTKETTTLLIKGKVVKEFLGEQRNAKSFVKEIRTHHPFLQNHDKIFKKMEKSGSKNGKLLN